MIYYIDIAYNLNALQSLQKYIFIIHRPNVQPEGVYHLKLPGIYFLYHFFLQLILFTY